MTESKTPMTDKLDEVTLRAPSEYAAKRAYRQHARALERDHRAMREALEAIDAAYAAHARLYPDDVPAKCVREARSVLAGLKVKA